MNTLLLLLILGTGPGPILDPIAGETLTRQEYEELPSGRHLGWIGDHLFLSVINMQNGGGGLGTFDPLYLSAHGRSWTQLRLTLNNQDLTDPARPGSPMIHIPDGLWSTLTHRSLWTPKPGFHYHLSVKPTHQGTYSRIGFGAPTGGGLWIPAYIMDREPATNYGAPNQRRSLHRTGIAEIGYADPKWGQLFASHQEHRHRYPVTLESSPGHPITDEARMTSLWLMIPTKWNDIENEFILAWQGRDRSHEGAQFRHPEALTGREKGNAFLILDNMKWPTKGPVEVEWGNTLSYRKDSFRRHSDSPVVRDIEQEWMWLARPRHTGDLTRFSWSGLLKSSLKHDAGELLFNLRHVHSQIYKTIEPSLVATSYNRATNSPKALTMTVYEKQKIRPEWLTGIRLDTLWAESHKEYGYQLYMGVDLDAAGGKESLGYAAFAPALGAVLNAGFGETQFFVMMRTEPDGLSSQVSAFLNPDFMNGQAYQWNDNGDMVPELAEMGTKRQRTGGRYHTRDPRLKRPQNYQFSLGVETPQFGDFKFRFTGSGRWHLNRFTVRYHQEIQQQYENKAIDGNNIQLAHKNERSYMSPTEAYGRDPSLMGNEGYVLTNAEKSDYWIGSEIQFITVENKWWFVNLSAAGYWNFGGSAFGLFPDRNDPGIISESSADLNQQINEEGRIDQDRSFAVNLLSGVRLWDNWEWSTALRYRDGQPFTRMDTITGLPQGPTPVMTIWRGRVRHTFHMSTDMRFQYRRHIQWLDNAEIRLAIDLFNFFGSSTELLEDPRDGDDYRTPLEMVPGRTVFATIALRWNHGP